jgi:ADP-ribose pyrophosphatase
MAVKNKPPDTDFTEREISSRIAYKGKLLEVREDRVELPDGHEAAREYVKHPGAVLIIPMIDRETVLLEHQFRYPLRRHFYELPAGKMERGEDPLKTAQRELQEETGFAAAKWKHLATTFPCIGYSDEKIELYLAEELSYVGHQLDHGEFLDSFALSLTEALAWIERGTIDDIKTIMGLFWVAKSLPATP